MIRLRTEHSRGIRQHLSMIMSEPPDSNTGRIYLLVVLFSWHIVFTTEPHSTKNILRYCWPLSLKVA